MALAVPNVGARFRGSFWHVWAVIWSIGALWLSSLGGLIIIADFSTLFSTATTALVILATIAGAAFWSRRIAHLL